MAIAAITGASGLLGGNLAALLCERGVTVRAAKRPTSRVAHLADVAIEWHDADLDDVAGMARCFAGADVVYHCAAIATQTTLTSGPHGATNVRGTANVLAALLRARAATRASADAPHAPTTRAAGATNRATRLVHVSSVVTCALARPGEPDVDETQRWNYPEMGIHDVYAETKLEGERAVLAAAARADDGGGVDAVVVNPGFMIGPRDSKPSAGRLMIELANKKVPAASGGKNSFVDVRDVCRGMIAAAERGRRGERYILAGENLEFKDAFARMCLALDVAPPRLVLPDAAVRAAGAAADIAERFAGREIGFNSAMASYAIARGYRFTSQKAERELGYTRSSLDVAMRDAAAWFRENGMLPRPRQ